MLVACSGSGGSPGGAGKSASAAGSASAEAGPGPGDTGGIDADPARLPASRKEALDLIGRVIADPATFGPGVVKRSPYESDPATWPVLGADCVWQQKKPAASVLATLSRSYEVPAAGAKGPMRLSAVVTVHRTRDDARWEMAESVEETMRCPTQQLRQGEMIGSMIASSLAEGEATQSSAEDVLFETGKYQNAELGGGPYPYSWYQAQSLQFTVAVTGKGAKGWSEQDIDTLTSQAHSTMLLRLEAAVEKQS
ncbi:hypothetical protein ACFVW8_29725 [Streptomyces sp. NPDC058221]|uniref:hypothetical protein n=1 Tax=Streptomyces sp. NPDC058221 TaxID=3346388 RepID=UPI0036E2AAA6